MAQNFKYSLKSNASLSYVNSLTTCESGDIQVNYNIPTSEYNVLKDNLSTQYPLFFNAESSPFLSKLVRQIPEDKSNNRPAMTTMDICVPRKCNDGSHPINIGKFLDPKINMINDLNLPFKNQIDLYMCASPGLYQKNKDGLSTRPDMNQNNQNNQNNEDDHECKNGGKYMQLEGPLGMCLDLPKYYFKNLQ